MEIDNVSDVADFLRITYPKAVSVTLFVNSFTHEITVKYIDEARPNECWPLLDGSIKRHENSNLT